MMRRDGLPFRTMLHVAAQSSATEAARCRLVLDVLGTAAAVRAALRPSLVELHVSELDIEVLLTLFSLQPEPGTPAFIAAHASATRAAVTESVDRLEARQWVTRERDTHDRRSVFVRLTTQGEALAQDLITRFIGQASRLADNVAPGAEKVVGDACDSVCAAAARLLRHAEKSLSRP